jgi:hypothetical protein
MRRIETGSSLANTARRQVLEVVMHERQPAVIVDSPPGAGKTDLVEAVVATAVRHADWRVVLTAPRVEQTYDLVRRIKAHYDPIDVTLFHSDSREPPSDVVRTGVRLATRPNALPRSSGVVIGTAKKLVMSAADINSGDFDLLVCDEAYQLPANDLDPVAHVAKQLLLVGDPGQLPPLVRGDIARFEAAPVKVHWPCPKELLRRHPALPRISLPTTFRFPQDTVDFVQPSFYPNLPFVSGVSTADRRLRFLTTGISGSIDTALNQVSGGASIVALLLPARAMELDDVDEELAQLAAEVIARILERGAEWVGNRRLVAGDIGYVDAHVASNAAVERQLRRKGIGPETMATTPEIWQGLQRPLMVAKHTLSGIGRLDAFALEPGRLCVMSSRHQLGCILVGRDGVGTALERHQHDCAARPAGADDATWAGWLAHRTLWNTLETEGRLVRI